MLLLSWNKAKKQGKKEHQKKGKSQKETKKQGRTKKIKKRKRETGNEKEKWRKPRRKKVRHWEMNKTNPFSGGKQCICKLTNQNTKRKERKKGLGPTAPKHTCRVASTQAQEENAEKSKTRKEERGFSKDPFSNSQKRKNGVEKEHRKTRKNHLHRSRKQISGNGPNRTQTATELQKRKRAKNFTNWAPPGQNGKNVILKISSVLQPQAVFWLPNPNWSKIRTSEKNKFVRPWKICVKNVLQHQGDTTGPTQINQAPRRKIGPKRLVLKGFASYYLLDCAWKSPDQKHTQKSKIFRTAKNDLDDLQNGIFEKPEKSENSEETWFPETAKKTFRAIKTVVSKRGGANERMGGRKWTLETRFGGPQMNPVAYIYIYIYAVELITGPRLGGFNG